MRGLHSGFLMVTTIMTIAVISENLLYPRFFLGVGEDVVFASYLFFGCHIGQAGLKLRQGWH